MLPCFVWLLNWLVVLVCLCLFPGLAFPFFPRILLSRTQITAQLTQRKRRGLQEPKSSFEAFGGFKGSRRVLWAPGKRGGKSWRSENSGLIWDLCGFQGLKARHFVQGLGLLERGVSAIFLETVLEMFLVRELVFTERRHRAADIGRGVAQEVADR